MLSDYIAPPSILVKHTRTAFIYKGKEVGACLYR